MAKYILIHGGAHGAWCWDRAKLELEARGHEAISLDLPGHGQDKTEREKVDISSYVDAVVSLLDKRSSERFTLVGHSLAGVVLPGVAAQRPEQVDELVFLAALVLAPGERVIDFIPEERRPSYFQMANLSADNSFLVDFKTARKVFFNDLSDGDAEKYYAMLTPQALGVYLEKAKVDPAKLPQRKRYIVCKEDLALGYRPCLEFAQKLGGRLDEVDAGHDVMLSQPENLVDVLLM
jgi:pimeloyl-ACP methyl ester carboxylesterase